MPIRSEAFPSKWLKGADLQGRSFPVTVRRVTLEEVGDEEKYVVWFEGKEKGMVLNATNWDMLEHITKQPNSDHWAGAVCVLTTESVSYQGKVSDALRLKPMPAQGPVAGAPSNTAANVSQAALNPPHHSTYAAQNLSQELNDDIPF